MVAIASTSAGLRRATASAAAPRVGPRGSACLPLHPHPARSYRCRRSCCARVMAFRWGDSSDATSTDSTKKTTNGDINSKLGSPWAPSPPSLMRSGRDYLDNEEKNPVDEAIEEMQREERLRDVQRSVVEALEGAQGWWANLPDKRSLFVGGGALLVAAYLSSAVVAAVDRVPLLPGLFQSVGFGFSCWFWWRYVLFAAGRRELATSLGQLRRRVAESVEGLAGETIASHPNAGSGETGAADTARKVVDRLAARHDETTQQHQQRWEHRQGQQGQGQGGGLRHDDGSWVDEPSVQEGISTSPAGGGVSEGYVAGLIEELDDKMRDMSGRDAAGGGGGRPPVIFAFLVSGPGGAAELQAEEPGAEELQQAGGGGTGGSEPPVAPTPRSDKMTGIAASGGGGAVSESGQAEMVDLDPCLGWDTEACQASGHLKLGQPDSSKLDALEAAALRTAREATGFSRHVDQVLHEVTSHNQQRQGSMDSVNLEGEYGRAAGTMEREVMEQAATHNPDSMIPKSNRKPSLGEQAGL